MGVCTNEKITEEQLEIHLRTHSREALKNFFPSGQDYEDRFELCIEELNLVYYHDSHKWTVKKNGRNAQSEGFVNFIGGLKKYLNQPLNIKNFLSKTGFYEEVSVSTIKSSASLPKEEEVVVRESNVKKANLRTYSDDNFVTNELSQRDKDKITTQAMIDNAEEFIRFYYPDAEKSGDELIIGNAQYNLKKHVWMDWLDGDASKGKHGPVSFLSHLTGDTGRGYFYRFRNRHRFYEGSLTINICDQREKERNQNVGDDRLAAIKSQQTARKIWRESERITPDSLEAKYISDVRGLVLDNTEIRAGTLKFDKDGCKKQTKAILFPIKNLTGEVTGVFFVGINEEDVHNPLILGEKRKTRIGRLENGSVDPTQVGNYMPGSTLIIVEGEIDAYTISQNYLGSEFFPNKNSVVWSCHGVDNFVKLNLPQGIDYKNIRIVLDNDIYKNLKEKERIMKRINNIREKFDNIVPIFPPTGFKDFNDYLLGKRIADDVLEQMKVIDAQYDAKNNSTEMKSPVRSKPKSFTLIGNTDGGVVKDTVITTPVAHKESLQLRAVSHGDVEELQNIGEFAPISHDVDKTAELSSENDGDSFKEHKKSELFPTRQKVETAHKNNNVHNIISNNSDTNQEEKSSSWFEEWVYLIPKRKFINFSTDEELSPEDFDVLFMDEAEKPSTYALKNGIKRIREEKCFTHTADKLVKVDGFWYINTNDGTQTGLSSSNIMDFIKKPSKTNWLVEGLFNTGDVVNFNGKTGAGKSYLLLNLFLSIAHGHSEWCGKKIENGLVVFCVGEGQNGLRKRIKAWHDVNGNNDLKAQIFDTPFILTDKKQLDAFKNKLKSLSESPKVIVFDTMAKYFEGDINKDVDAKPFLNALSELAREFNCVVAFTSHTGHKGEHSKGASNWKDDIDASFLIQNNNGIVTMEATKIKDGDCNQKFHFKFQSHTITEWYDGTDSNVTAILVPHKFGGKKEAVKQTVEDEIQGKPVKSSENGNDCIDDKSLQKFDKTKFPKPVVKKIDKLSDIWRENKTVVENNTPYIKMENIVNYLKKEGLTDKNIKVELSLNKEGRLMKSLVDNNLIEIEGIVHGEIQGQIKDFTCIIKDKAWAEELLEKKRN